MRLTVLLVGSLACSAATNSGEGKSGYGAIQLIESGFEAPTATIWDGPDLYLPSRVASEGDCSVLVRPPLGQCDPACGDGMTCLPNSECGLNRVKISAGSISVSGLRQAMTFEPGAFGYTPTPAPPADLFADDAVLRVSAEGEEVGEFSGEVRGVEPLVAPDQNLVLVDAMDSEVTWTAGTGGHQIQLALQVGWHGSPFEAMLLCETADDGSLTLPKALIAALPRQQNLLEQHPSWLLRFSRMTVDVGAGAIEVLAGSQLPVRFSHP